MYKIVGQQIKQNSQLPLALNIADKASFENFYTGNNTELVDAIQSCVLNSESRGLYFYGPIGSGKSHLMFGAVRLAHAKGNKCSYLSLADPSMRAEFLKELELDQIICIDNINEWAGDDLKEAALFTMFEQIKHSEGHLIISANNSPDHCGFKLKDLISRLSSGLVYPLQELSDEQQSNAIKMRANELGMTISDEVVKYLLIRSSRNTGELFAILDKIDRVSLVEKRKITIPFIRTMNL